MNHQNMNFVNVTEQHQHLSEHRESAREAALKRLEALRGTVIVGDILDPLDEEWTGDADNL
ncbi:MAG: hypothetical protein Q7U66_05575 [Methylobacter sp.]|nr:hypothetical protein [Methylobacter sp.]